MVLLREAGMTQPAIAEAMGVSLSTVNRAHMAFDRGGLAALEPKRSGERIRENMTLGEERALLARFAKAAGAGEMVNIHDLKAAYVRKPALDLSVIVRGAVNVDTDEHHKCAFAERSSNCSAAPSSQAPTPE